MSSSTLRAVATPCSDDFSCEFGWSARATEKTTSSAVNGLPSWNLTPGRKRKRHVPASGCAHETASAGTMRKSRSRATSPS